MNYGRKFDECRSWLACVFLNILNSVNFAFRDTWLVAKLNQIEQKLDSVMIVIQTFNGQSAPLPTTTLPVNINLPLENITDLDELNNMCKEDENTKQSLVIFNFMD